MVLTAILAIGAMSAGTAGACACGESRGPVVANGLSPNGVPWKVRASRPVHSEIIVSFEMEPPAYYDVGYDTTLSSPVPKSFVFTADTGEDLDPYPESDLSGVTDRRVRTLSVKMSAGQPLVIQPRLAPASIRTRFKWLRGLRFFDQFYAAGPLPEVATASDASGHQLARIKSNRGSFAAETRPSD